MLKLLNLFSKSLTSGHHSVPKWVLLVLVAELIAPLCYGLLESNSQKNLLLLDDGEVSDVSKKSVGCVGCDLPLIEPTVPVTSSTHRVDAPFPTLLKVLENGKIAVGYPGFYDPRTGFILKGSNPTVSIEQSGNVAFVHLVLREKAANSGNTQNGQSRAKQVERPGMCREQVPPAQAKVCSELHGNMERSAEMTDPLGVYHCMNIHSLQQYCNTKYIHFYVDPLMLFRWSESRTWPNQLVDIRILSLRLALVYKARMFATVLDGWTA